MKPVLKNFQAAVHGADVAEMANGDEPSTEFLRRHLTISVKLYGAAASGVVVYAAATPNRPARLAVTVVAAVAALFAGSIVYPLRDRIIASPHRFDLLYGWSGLTFGCVALLALLDGGVGSPLLLLLVIALQYVAMAYVPMVVASFSVGAVALVTLVAAVEPGHASPALSAITAFVLAMCGLLGTLASQNRQTEQHAQATLAAQLDDLARSDSLTGCLNRRCFDEVIATRFEESARLEQSISLLLLDLDEFKYINDTFGHPVGDLALQALANALKAEARDGEVVARLGGDEFAMLLPDTTDDAALRWRQVTHAVSRIDEPVPLSTSIGLATCRARDSTIAELIRLADRALYQSKSLRRTPIDQHHPAPATTSNTAPNPTAG